MYPGQLGQSGQPGQPGRHQQFDSQGNPVVSNAGGLQYNPAQMQAYNGYNSMPPPGVPMQQANQYQGHMRNNSQTMPVSPGYIQSPMNFSNPTQQFYPQQISTPQPVSSASPQATNHSVQQNSSIAGPDTSQLQNNRISVLLELNRHLLQEVANLNAVGKGISQQKQGESGAQSPSTSEADGESVQTSDDTTKKASQSSREFMDYMYRLRGNFAYLTNLASPNQPKVMPRPQNLDPLAPSDLTSAEALEVINELYKKLRELFSPAAQQQLASSQAMQQQQQQPQFPQQSSLQQQGFTAQQQAQSMQQQMMHHQAQQQQMAAQAAQAGGMSTNPQMLYQQQQMMLARSMQNQSQSVGQTM